MVDVPHVSLDVRTPFLRRQALAAGLTDRDLAGERFHRLHTGVYLSCDVRITPAIRAVAATLAFGPDAFASHATAARVLRLPVPPSPQEHVTVAARADRRRRDGVACHHLPAGVEPSVIQRDGARVSAPEQVFVELATQLSLVDLVVVGDHAVRSGLVRLDRLRAFVMSWSGPGRAQARAAVAFVRERVDSPMETRVRMLIVLAGLPEPRVNITYGEQEGMVCRRYDLSWPEIRLIVEYDGRHHVERIEQWESDLDRREAIDESGWRILVVVASGIYATPEQTLAKIHRVLLDSKLPGVPKRLKPAWQRHFPGRY